MALEQDNRPRFFVTRDRELRGWFRVTGTGDASERAVFTDAATACAAIVDTLPPKGGAVIYIEEEGQ